VKGIADSANILERFLSSFCYKFI